MGATRFTLTERQIQALIAATPPGYVPEVVVRFRREEDSDTPEKARPTNPADLVDP
jgi:hypothetical protein